MLASTPASSPSASIFLRVPDMFIRDSKSISTVNLPFCLSAAIEVVKQLLVFGLTANVS
jgi:hypothetical protein